MHGVIIQIATHSLGLTEFCAFSPQDASLPALCPVRNDASRGVPAIGAFRVGSAAAATLGPTGRIALSQYYLDFPNPDCFFLITFIT